VPKELHFVALNVHSYSVRCWLWVDIRKWSVNFSRTLGNLLCSYRFSAFWL